MRKIRGTRGDLLPHTVQCAAYEEELVVYGHAAEQRKLVGWLVGWLWETESRKVSGDGFRSE
jgi:hypothetical protein